MIKITAHKAYIEGLPNRAAEMTTHGQPVKAPNKAWFKSEHSPIRLFKYWIELEEIPTFVSVHLVRHKFGLDHFVKSMRDDRGGDDGHQVTRMTPVTHGIEINAQALINTSRKRLCYKSHVKTVGIWRRLIKAVDKVEPDLAKFCVPECVYRRMCPEFSECKPGLHNVLHAYREYPLYQDHIKKYGEIK